MHSSIRAARRVAAAFVLVFLVSVCAVAPARAAPVPPLERCQHAIATAGSTFVARQLTDLGRCTTAALVCAYSAPADLSCLVAAGDRCTRMLARVVTRERRLARMIAGRCGSPVLDARKLLGPDGLGFADLAAACPALGTAHADAAAVGACVARLHRCQGDRLLAIILPRARELMRVAGVPAETLAAETCLADRGGNGAGDPVAGPAIARCARTTGRAGVRLVARALASFAVCTRATLPCVGARAGEAACTAQATAVCDRAFRRFAGARLVLGRALGAACGEAQVEFGALAAAAGANIAALTDDCAAVRVDEVGALPAYTVCLARNQECEVEATVRLATPRAAELLALVGRTLVSPFCPLPEPTVTPEPTATPTATSTGPTVTPRPGETATPTPTPSPTLTPTPRPTPTAPPVCGNGLLEDGEECDGLDLDDNACDDLCDEPDPPGTLACRTDCRFDFRGCRGVECEAP